jgi:hypothetical protein
MGRRPGSYSLPNFTNRKVARHDVPIAFTPNTPKSAAPRRRRTTTLHFANENIASVRKTFPVFRCGSLLMI